MPVLLLLLLAVSVAVQNPPALDPGKVFAYDASKPLNVKMGKTEEVEMMQVTEISYDSPKIGRVPGYLVVPPGKGPFGGILYMHWGQGNRGEWLAEGVEMAKRGAVCITIDAPYWRPEVPSPGPNNRAEVERDGYIQMVVDLRRAVDVLVSQGCRPQAHRIRRPLPGRDLGRAAGRGREADQDVRADGWPAFADELRR